MYTGEKTVISACGNFLFAVLQLCFSAFKPNIVMFLMLCLILST